MIRSGPRAGTQIIGCTQSCQGCCLVSTTASVVQFYTGKELSCYDLQCSVSTACAPGTIGPCLPHPPVGTSCPPAYYGGTWTYLISATALGILVGHMPAGGSCDMSLTCPDSYYPGGRVDPCPDASGTPYWSAAHDLTVDQLNKVLSAGNPVILILQFELTGYTHSLLIGEKDGDSYHVWDPSTDFNPKQIWQQLQFADISTYTSPSGSRASWKQTVWGGNTQLC